ncbi:MAG TPA: Mur ligase family protein [Candidatus Andersenbacteria bacterium]|nr:Mur ligase family protein [Candidatus Andersenbacteria bacterium]
MSVYVAILAIAAIDAIFIVLSQTALWQRKEYRIDRMRAYINSPELDMKQVGIWIIATILAALGFWYMACSLVSMLVLLAAYALRATTRGIFRPKLTARSIAVTGIALASILLLIAFVPSAALIAFVVVLSPVINALVVGIITTPAMLKKRSVISKAISYRKNLTGLTVIGITGSVGKTSTKTYALHILEGDTREVIATQAHRNSPYVVAIDMITRVTAATSTYIAELAAYRPGEIEELCSIVQPSIGVITAITNQHVAMFGSLERLARTKWELAEALPAQGTLILNKDDKNITALAHEAKQQILWYSMREQADVAFEHIALHIDHTQCDLVINNQRQHVDISIVSRGQLGSVLAACAIGFARGMSVSEIATRLSTLPRLEKTMEYRKLLHGAVIIDDSYSASEASVINAIEYLREVGDEKSLLILVPIIELGSEGAIVHERIGKALAEVPFQVMIYGNAYKTDIVRGLEGAISNNIAWYTDPKILTHEIEEIRTAKNIIVIEGRVPKSTYNALI